MSRQQLKEKGFTIIEVVLVLAIAALIFLMVFIALPALQRNQRDTARKTVLGKVASSITTYQSNNRGKQPANGLALRGYVDGTAPVAPIPSSANLVPAYTATANDTIVDNDYIVTVRPWVAADIIGNADTNVVQVLTGAKCGSDAAGTRAVKGTSRNAAVFIVMENGLPNPATTTAQLRTAVTCQEV